MEKKKKVREKPWRGKEETEGRKRLREA